MRKTLAVLLVLIAGSARSAHAQAPKPAFATEVATSDSLAMDEATESPDGRWLLFSSGIRSGPTHLWIMPSGGGAPKRLTDGNYHDGAPVWFPSGRRIAFTSSRVGAIMAADFDPDRGVLASAPRRISLEEANAFDISPDGRQIAYLNLRNNLRLLPANGGSANTILDQSAAGSLILALPKFSADGRDVYVSGRGQGGSTIGKLLRVPVGGGPPATALTGPADGIFWSVVADPVKDRVLIYAQRTTSILTLRGDTLASIPAIRAGMLASFSRDGRRLLKATTNVNSMVRVVPTNGGKSMNASPGTGYDWPMMWSADGTRLYSVVGDSTAARTRPGLLESTVKGGSRRFISFAPTDTSFAWKYWREMMLVGDGRYWALVPRMPDIAVPVLLYDTKTRQTRELTRTGVRLVPSRGDGVVENELHYVEHRGTGFVLRSVAGDGEPRLEHEFTHFSVPGPVALHGDRIAIAERVGDSTVIYLARGTAAEQRLTSLPGAIVELAWSPDGRTLAGTFSTRAGGAGASFGIVFVGVSEQGTLRGVPRQVRTDADWNLFWVPDGRAVTVLEEKGTTSDTRVIRVPVNAGEPVVSLTPDERGTFWGQLTSPDGRYMAIPVEQFGSSTLWSIDVDAAGKAWREKKTQTSSRPNTQ